MRGPGADLVMAISGSGNSPSVVKAVECQPAGCKTLVLTGRDGGELGRAGQLNIKCPCSAWGIEVLNMSSAT